MLDVKESKDNGDQVPFLPSISNAVVTETEVKLVADQVVRKDVGSRIEVQLKATLRLDFIK